MSTDYAVPDEIVSCDSAPESAPGSPKDKIKFLCSHGGKILPRPSDGHLKYVGGETRVISVTRDIKLQELMKKLTYQIEGNMVLKYQLVPEDLDALVSVKSDEDIRYMIEECDRSATKGSPRLRAFLFPAKPLVLDPLGLSVEAVEQRYVDAINGIIRPGGLGNNVGSGTKPTTRPGFAPNRPVFSISSACSSPRSPDDDALSNHGHFGFLNDRNSLHKVQSMPSFGSSLSNTQQHNGHYTPPVSGSPRSHYQNYTHQNHFHGYQLGRPAADPFRGPHRMGSGRSPGSPHNNFYYYPRPSRGRTGNCTKCTTSQFDDWGHYWYERRSEKAARSASASPIPLSPRYGHGGGIRLWEAPMAPPEPFN